MWLLNLHWKWGWEFANVPYRASQRFAPDRVADDGSAVWLDKNVAADYATALGWKKEKYRVVPFDGHTLKNRRKKK